MVGGWRANWASTATIPSIDQNDERRNDACPTTDEPAPAPAPPKKVDLPPPEAVDKAISTIQKYKTAGDGGTCLKTLGAYLRNALNKGDQDENIGKFRWTTRRSRNASLVWWAASHCSRPWAS